MHCPVSCLIRVFYVLVYVNKINDYVNKINDDDEIILSISVSLFTIPFCFSVNGYRFYE